MHDYAVFIGRFQPFHKGHLENVKFAFSVAKKVIIVVGGYHLAPSVTDPWTALERKKMIVSTLTKNELKNVEFVFVRDRLYNEELWKENVRREVECIAGKDANIAIIGHLKDSSSYYLKIFPTWTFIETKCVFNTNGTDFRKEYFSHGLTSFDILPKQVTHIVKNFKNKNLFKKLKNEYQALNKVLLNEQAAFICIIVGVYLLLIKRKNFPGKNLYSLPSIEGLELDDTSKQYFVLQKTFYCPKFDNGRKNGKTILFYQIPNHVPFDMKKYTNKQQTWLLLDDLYLIENKMFADHYQIIRTLMANRV